MMRGQKPDKRIVSREEYARIQGKCTLLRIGAIGLYLLTAVFGLIAAETLLSLLIALGRGMVGPLGTVWILLWFLLTATGFVICKTAGKKLMQRAKELGSVSIATRANTASLPVEETLVRASVEPIEQYQAVLLRAVAQSDPTSEEHLVRPVNGSEEC